MTRKKVTAPNRIRGKNDIPSNPKDHKPRMSFRMSHDVYLFLQSQKQEGRNQTALVERAIRKCYFKDGVNGSTVL